MIIFSDKILNDSQCEIIKNYILTNEERIKKLGPDIYPGTQDDSLTGRYSYFNYLNEFEIGNIIVPKLVHIFKMINLKFPIAIQCWANTFRKNQGIEYHCHGPKDSTFICGNIFISGPTTPGTTYKIDNQFVDIENNPGTLNLFYSTLGHMVKPNSSDEVRVSMAFDVIENVTHEQYYANLQRYFIIKSFDDNYELTYKNSKRTFFRSYYC